MMYNRQLCHLTEYNMKIIKGVVPSYTRNLNIRAYESLTIQVQDPWQTAEVSAGFSFLP